MSGCAFDKSVGLIGSIFTRHWLDPEAVVLWTDRATVQTWLDVEAALAKAQAELGLIPTNSAAVIAAHADAGRIDFDQVAVGTAHTLHPFVPVLRQFEAQCGEPHAGYIHWGATTQNIFDTAQALQLKRTHVLIMNRLDGALSAMASLALEHRGTPQAGRTHGQHALPITFGFKVAGWMSELLRHRQRLADLEVRAFACAMGGAVGSFAAMGGMGRLVQKRTAALLKLADAGIPSRSSADRQAEYVALLGQIAATTERIARDVVFMQRTEVGEVFESFHHGKVGSSTMAQKRNPSWALNLIGLSGLIRSRLPAAIESMLRADEGDAGLSNLCDAILPETAILGCSIVTGLQRLVGGLQVDAAAMRRNLGLTQGLIVTEAVMMALGHHIGRHRAHDLLYDAAMRAFEEGLPLIEVLATRPEIAALGTKVDLASLLDPTRYTGEAQHCVDELCASQAATGLDAAAE